MRIRWDKKKRQKVYHDREINFSSLEDLFCLPYIEDQKNDDPEQYRVIGYVSWRILTFIIEYREDDLGEFIWIVTAWPSTKQEKNSYEKSTK